MNNEIFNKNFYLKEFFRGIESPVVWNKIIKLSLYRDNRITYPENLSIGEDLYTISKIILKAKKIGKISDEYIHYIQTNNGLMKTKSKKILKLFEIFENLEKYMKENYKNKPEEKIFFSNIDFLKLKNIKSILYDGITYKSDENKIIYSKFLDLLKTNNNIDSLKEFPFTEGIILKFITKKANIETLKYISFLIGYIKKIKFFY